MPGIRKKILEDEPPWDSLAMTMAADEPVPPAPALLELLRGMLEKDDAKRLTAAECLQSDWFRGERADEGGRQTWSAENVRRLSAMADASPSRRKNRKMLMNKLATQVSVRQLGQVVTDAFKQLDVDGDGMVSKTELMNSLKQSGLQQEAAEQIWRVFELDGDEVVSFNEFAAACLHESEEMVEKLLWRDFKQFDHDGDGHVTKQELAEFLTTGRGDRDPVLRRILMETEKDPAELVQAMDKNSDGLVSFEEFKAFLFN